MDSAFTTWINSWAGIDASLDNFMVDVSKFGVPLMVLLVISQWWSGIPRPQARHACIAAGASLALGLGLAQLMLLFIHRERPYEVGVSHLIIAKTADWSFPSDHAIAWSSIVFAWAMNAMRRWLWVFIGLAALIGLSRVYVGMHYASDIIGGMAVALIAVWVVRIVYKPDTKLDRWLTGWF